MVEVKNWKGELKHIGCKLYSKMKRLIHYTYKEVEIYSKLVLQLITK